MKPIQMMNGKRQKSRRETGTFLENDTWLILPVLYACLKD